MLIVRFSKVLMAAALAAFAFIITYDNVVDYDSNYEFVKHVLSMDTTFPGNKLMGRAITDPDIWRFAYGALIVTEGLTCTFLALGAISMLQAIARPAVDFDRSKSWVIAGATLGFCVWFFGFMVVGGEYFAMWQSKTWNGQEAAFRFYMAILGVLIFVNQPEAERS